MVPHAIEWNTYTMSEYNDTDTSPVDFPIGVGKNHLGLFFDKPVLSKQNIIKNPYAVVYIQSSGDGLLHSRYCFLSFVEISAIALKFSYTVRSWKKPPCWGTKPILNFKVLWNIGNLLTSSEFIKIDP